MSRSLHPFSTFIYAALLLVFSAELSAQKSAAELISQVAPPQDQIKYTDGARQVSIHNNFLFITNVWAGLQVIDISDIENPSQVAYFPSTDESFHTTIEGQYAYLANQASGVRIFDISDMQVIHPVATIKPPGNAQWVVAEYPYLFVALGHEGFCVMDISDVNNPITVKLEIPGHWIQQLDKEGDLLFLAAKKGGLITYDVSNLENPRKLSQFRTGFNTMMVQVEGNVAYLADGPGGLLCMNIENPEFPIEISRVKGAGFVGSLDKVGSYAYLGNRDVGLQIVNISDPQNPFPESRYGTEDKTYGVVKRDIYVFLAANTHTLIMRHNNSPVLQSVGDQTLQENTPFLLQLMAAEPDGDEILYDVAQLPEGATFDNETGVMEWTPTFEQSGNYPNVVFSVTEQTKTRLSVSDTVTISVQHVNRVPDLPALEDGTVGENAELTFMLPEGSDPDVEDQMRMTYLAEKLPEGAVFDSPSKTFSWTPSYEQSGQYVVDFLLDDGGGGIDREPVTITVNHVDRPPLADAVANQTIDENALLTLTITGMEPDSEDQEKISYAMRNLPDGSSFDATTQVFTWTPTYDQSGSYENISAIMTAGAFSDTVSFSIAVNHINRAPVLDPVTDQAVNENAPLTFTVGGRDADVEDAGLLVYSATNLPAGATFDPASKTFNWTPDFEQSGGYVGVIFTVADPSGLSASQEITITASHVNRSPQIEAVADQSVDENNALSIQLSASDPDVEDANGLTFSALSLPEGAAINAATGLVNWTPGYDQSGIYPVTFVISDGQYSDSAAATVTVNHVNRPPVLDGVAEQSIDENMPLSFTLSGSDPDVEDAGLLTLAATGLPEGATFDPATGIVAWTPTYEQSGTYTVSATLTDAAGLSDSKQIPVVVNHVNRAPSLAPLALIQADENTPVAFQAVGTDPDTEDTGLLRYSVANLPAGAALGDQDGSFAWTPGYDQSSEYTLNITVTDGSGFTAMQSVEIHVANINRPPTIAAIPAQAGAENSQLQFTVPGTDPDNEDAGNLVYGAENLPAGAVLDAATGQFLWMPTYEQSGSYQVGLKVTDTFSSTAVTTVDISINHVNREPVIPEIRLSPINENEIFNMALPAANDPDAEDADKLVYSLASVPDGATFDAGLRKISWKPTYDQAGDYPMDYSASDGSATVAKTLHLRVNNVNRPPVIESLSEASVAEGASLSFSVSAHDPDAGDGDTVEIDTRNMPSGASFSGSEFEWTPDHTQQGTYTVEFIARDASGEIDKTSISITVQDVPEPEPAPEPENE